MQITISRGTHTLISHLHKETDKRIDAWASDKSGDGKCLAQNYSAVWGAISAEVEIYRDILLAALKQDGTPQAASMYAMAISKWNETSAAIERLTSAAKTPDLAHPAPFDMAVLVCSPIQCFQQEVEFYRKLLKNSTITDESNDARQAESLSAQRLTRAGKITV